MAATVIEMSDNFGGGRKRLRWMLLAAVLLVTPRGAVAQTKGLAVAGEEKITIDAESISYEGRTGRALAEGRVLIRRGDSKLRADRVRVDRRTNEAEALGHVSLTTEAGAVFADRMRIDLDDETGELLDAEVHAYRLGYSLRGDRIQKGYGQSYRIENGRFTTCRCAEGKPSWGLAGKVLDVDLNGYARLKQGTLNILDIPVFYVPRLAFPVSKQRQSGLLFPRFGVSNLRGFQVLQPVYWAIDKSQDATAAVDIETGARIGLIGEYRYAASRHLRGSLTASYFNEAIRGAATGASTLREANPHVPENRWGTIGEHTLRDAHNAAYLDFLLVGDDLFLREMNTFALDHAREVGYRTLPFTRSQGGFVHRWERLAVQAGGVFYQDLIGRDSLVLQRLPEVQLIGQKRLGPLLIGELGVNAVNFQRSRGIDGVRLDFRPQVRLRLPLGRSVFGSVRTALRETAYYLSQNEMSGGFRGDGDPADRVRASSRSRETFEVGADLRTGLSRIFPFRHFGVDKLKHLIEPRVEFLYVPSVGQNGIPVFDGIDRVNQRTLVTYGFDTRLLARSKPETEGADEPPSGVYELTRLSVSQSYDLDRVIPAAGGRGAADHFSDIDFSLRINPSPRTSVRFRSNFDTSRTDFSAATVEIRLREAIEKRSARLRARLLTRSSFHVSYRFITSTHVSGSTASESDGAGPALPDVQQVDGSFVVRLTDRLGFRYASVYDIPNSRFLENHFGFRLVSACDCWSLDLGVTDKANPNEVEFRVQFMLLGLGGRGKKDRF